MDKNKYLTLWLSFGAATNVVLVIINLFEKAKNGAIKNVNIQGIELATEICNLLVLVGFFLFIKPTKLNFKNETDILKLATYLNILDEGLTVARENIEKVNKLISQVYKNLTWFVLFTAFFYAASIIKTLEYGTNPGLLVHSEIKYKILELFIISCNLISGAFIYLSFKVLYAPTLKENNVSDFYYKGTLLFVFSFLLSFAILLFFSPINPSSIIFLSIYPLICGVYNGVTMCLLFGRFISMEYFFKDIKTNTGDRDHAIMKVSWFTNFINKKGIIYILPVYALTQPMLGLFDVTDYHNFPEFKSIVFLVCLLCKCVFLLVIANSLSSRFLHAYLHLILSTKDLLANFTMDRSVSIPTSKEILSPYLINVAGEFEYVCTHSLNENHTHGGRCTIELLSSSDNTLELSIKGTRVWSKDGNLPKIISDTELCWSSDKCIIFKDKKYMYSFSIDINGTLSRGTSVGFIILTEDNKSIKELRGNYFQQQGDKLFSGIEKITRISHNNTLG